MAKSRKIVLSLPEKPYALYMRFLQESMLTPSSFFIAMLAEKERGIAEQSERRPVGRPKKETDDERAARYAAEPKDTPHPDQGDAFCGHNGMMVTRREAEAWCEIMDMDENKRDQVKTLKYYIPVNLRRVND